MPDIDWIIEILANGVYCATCGKVENHYPDYICNAHTHGMAKYGLRISNLCFTYIPIKWVMF